VRDATAKILDNTTLAGLNAQVANSGTSPEAREFRAPRRAAASPAAHRAKKNL